MFVKKKNPVVTTNMKIEIDDLQPIDKIAKRIIQRLKFMLNGSHNPKDNALMDVKGIWVLR